MPQEVPLVIASLQENIRNTARGFIKKAAYQRFRNRTWVFQIAQAIELCLEEPDIIGATVRASCLPPKVNRPCFNGRRTEHHSSFAIRSFLRAIIYSSINNIIIAVSYRLSSLNILCREAAHSDWLMPNREWLHSPTLHHAFLSKEGQEMTTNILRQRHVRPWCALNVPRLLLQIHIIVLR